MNTNNTSVYIHLYYDNIGIFLLNKLKEIWDGEIFLSLVKDNKPNDIIVETANNLFKKVNITLVDNKGTDQIGFFASFKYNKNNTKDWILYWHDKGEDKLLWLNNLIEIFDIKRNIIQNLMQDKNVGIISSEKHKTKILLNEDLEKKIEKVPLFNRIGLIREFQTVVWLLELQYLFNYYNKKRIIMNQDFCAGTVFLIRSDIVDSIHKCISSNYFENFYRPDGDIGHALERFYYYGSECMGYKNVFI